MSILSFTEASKKLGFKSRSSLYWLNKRGLLDQYLCEIGVSIIFAGSLLASLDFLNIYLQLFNGK